MNVLMGPPNGETPPSGYHFRFETEAGEEGYGVIKKVPLEVPFYEGMGREALRVIFSEAAPDIQGWTFPSGDGFLYVDKELATPEAARPHVERAVEVSLRIRHME